VAANVAPEFITVLIIALFFSFFTMTKLGRRAEEICYAPMRPEWQHYVSFLCAMLFLVASAAYLSASGFNPFIYFKF